MANHRSRPLDKDKLFMIPRSDAVVGAHEALHPVQHMSPEQMMAGVAVLFFATVNRTGLDPEDMYKLGARLLADQEHHDKTNKLVQSLRDFAGLRVLGQDVVMS